MGKIGAFLKLTRIEHSIMLVIAVLAAEVISGGMPGTIAILASIITPILVSMGSFAINDYFDVDADRANGFKKRPLVSGELSIKTAKYSAILLLVVGALASAFINEYAFVIAVIFAALAYLYSYKMKDMLLVGNIYIAFSMVIPFIYGNFVVAHQFNLTIILISFVVFLSGLAREVHGMIRDKAGDFRERKSKNLIHHVGEARAANFALILYLEAIAISIYMFFFSIPFRFNIVYILPILLTDIILVYIAFGEIFVKDRHRFHKLSRNLSLLAMGIALIAYFAAALFFVAI